MNDELEPTPRHEERRNDLAAYALGALPASDADETRAHLRTCDSCNSYVDWLQRAVDVLPSSASQLNPPPGLKKSLMAEVKADVKRQRAAQRRSRGWHGVLLRPAIGATAAAVLVAGAVVGYELRPESSPPTSSTIAAQPTSDSPGGTMTASLVTTGDEGQLHVEHMPQLPNDRVYQTWLSKNGSMEPSTTFVVRKDVTSEVALDRNLSGADAVLVTTEPKGGSTFPTNPPILRASLR